MGYNNYFNNNWYYGNGGVFLKMSVESLSRTPITWHSKGTMNEYGEWTYTTSTINARVSKKMEEITNQVGQDVTSYAYIITPHEIKYEDKITLLDDGITRNVLKSYQIPDGQGNFHHSEVYI